MVWQWFEDALVTVQNWVPSLPAACDAVFTSAPGTTDPLPLLPALPPRPMMDPGPPEIVARIEHGLFGFFGTLVSGVKKN